MAPTIALPCIGTWRIAANHGPIRCASQAAHVLRGTMRASRSPSRSRSSACGSERREEPRLRDELERATVARHRKHADGTPSLTDASSIVVATRRRIDPVFAFDRHFTQYGCTPRSRADIGGR